MTDKYWTIKHDHDIHGCKIILGWYGKMEFKHMKWIVRDPYDLRNHEIPFLKLSPSAIPQCEPVDPVHPEPSKEPIDPEPEPEFHYHLWWRASAKPATPPRLVTPPASPIATPPASLSSLFSVPVRTFTPPSFPPHSPPGSPPQVSPPPGSPEPNSPAASPKGQIIFWSVALKKKQGKTSYFKYSFARKFRTTANSLWMGISKKNTQMQNFTVNIVATHIKVQMDITSMSSHMVQKIMFVNIVKKDFSFQWNSPLTDRYRWRGQVPLHKLSQNVYYKQNYAGSPKDTSELHSHLSTLLEDFQY